MIEKAISAVSSLQKLLFINLIEVKAHIPIFSIGRGLVTERRTEAPNKIPTFISKLLRCGRETSTITIRMTASDEYLLLSSNYRYCAVVVATPSTRKRSPCYVALRSRWGCSKNLTIKNEVIYDLLVFYF